VKRYLILIVFLLIGAILFQSFQCASPEMTTARLAYRDKDFKKAEEFFAKELQKAPKNAEANFLMANVKLKLNKTKEAAEYILAAEKLPLEPNFKQQVPLTKWSIWVSAFNSGITKYNKYYESQDISFLNEAIEDFNIALKLRPENAELFRVKGRAYEDMGNHEKSTEIYTIYADKLKKEIEFAKSSGIFVMMPRNDVLSKFGQPKNSFPTSQGEDSILTDYYRPMGMDVYIYYSMNENKKFVVEGWRVNPPADWVQTEKLQYTTLDIGPFATLSDYFLNQAENIRNNPKLDSAEKVKGINENLRKSMEYTKLISLLDPTNIGANSRLVELYQSQGKTDEAITEIGNLVKKEPDNKFYLAQFGDIYMRLSRYDDAIEQYGKALEIDPEFCDVLRNIAAAYKNKAVLIIQEQQDKRDKDKSYKEDPDEYNPFLLESVNYFTQSRNCEKYKYDLQVLGELANLYNALDMQKELSNIVSELERLEHAIPDEQKEDYWMKMCKILGDMGSPKAERACNEAKKFLEK
jgi:tetratricopeptide (TPR) repeat protein